MVDIIKKEILFSIIALLLFTATNTDGAASLQGQYSSGQNVANFIPGMNALALAVSETSAAPWWDTTRHFRLPVTIDAAGFERFEKPVDVDLNFTQLLGGLDQTGILDENSIRVVEIDSTGIILNASVPFQFDRDPNFNTATRASGNIVFIMSGTTQANGNRYYHIYFNVTGGSYTPWPITPLITLTDNIIDEGQSSYRVNIMNSTFFFQKEAGGFSSWNDKSGNDWIGWNDANGSSGEFRGIPNAVNPEEVFHPGFNCCSSSVISQGPIKIRIRSVNGTKWESIWDFYPGYATMTMTKVDHNYWFLYEGTPGGLLEKTKDFMFRSNGIKTFLNTSWTSDILNNEWVYFSDPEAGGSGRSLFVAHREGDNLIDSYWNQAAMTVFGFGRNGNSLEKLLSSVPQHFTIGMMDGTDFTQNSKLVYSAYKDLTITKGTAEQYGSIAPQDPTLKINIGTEVFNGTTYPTVTLENSVQIAVIRTQNGSIGVGGVESAIKDWTLKSAKKDLVTSFVDANSFRGVLSNAAITVNGTNSKTVRLTYSSGGIVEYTIDANSPILKIKYEKYNARTTSNVVDRTNTGGGTRVYGQGAWNRTIAGSYYECAYWDSYETTLVNCTLTYGPDPADAGSLNYKGHIIMAYGQTASNGIGFGRVMPVYTGTYGGIRILKIFSWGGFESYQAISSRQLTRPAHYGYIYLFQQGVDNAIMQGQQIVDGFTSPTAPVILTQPSDQNVTIGERATFSVVATGTAPLSYQWQKNGVNIPGATSATYITPATILEDNGSAFRCVVTNSAGSIISNSGILTVNPTLQLFVSVSENPDPVTSGQTSQVTIHVTTTGSSPIAGADLTVSTTGGSLDQTSGTTDANGDLNITYTAPAVTVNTQYTISAAASKTEYTDGSGNDLITVAPPADTTAPSSVSGLANISYAANYINWTWTDPLESDFDHVEVYLNGIFIKNVSKGVQYYNASTLSPGNLYIIGLRSVDTSGNVNPGMVTHSARTATLPDTTAPSSVSGLANISYAANYINWTWTDPSESDFDHVEVHLNGIFIKNVSKGVQYYNASTLSPGNLYIIGLRSVDTSGNINPSMVTHSARTAPVSDTIAPSNATGLNNISYAINHINWTWTDPSEPDFDHVDVYINGSFKKNVTKGIRSYNATGLSPDTLYTIGLRSVDTSGNVNPSMVMHSARTTLANIPNPPSTGGGGGGGGGIGGGGTSGENFTNIIVKERYDMFIFKDLVTSYKFRNINNPVLTINIVGNVNAGEIGTAVEVLRNTSSLVKNPGPGNVYKNVNVWVGTSGFGTSKNIKQAVITFRVENSWFSSNNINSSSIKLIRWDGSKWNELETSEKTKDSTYIYFEAKTDGFSSFAITGIENKEYVTENAEIIEPIEPNKPVATIQAEEKKSNSINSVFIIIGVLCAIGLIVGMYLRMKKK